MPKGKHVCIVPGCDRRRKWRGVCLACYFAAKRKIQQGEITDEELVRRKLWLRAKRGRPAKNMMAKAVMAVT